VKIHANLRTCFDSTTFSTQHQIL